MTKRSSAAHRQRLLLFGLVGAAGFLILTLPTAWLNLRDTVIAVAAIAVSAGLGYVLVRLALEHVFGKQTGKPSDPLELQTFREPKVGTWTGLIERTAVTLFVLTGLTAGIAVIVAIKGLGRIKELREDQGNLAEQFMLGSLLSLSWAAAVGVVALHISAQW